MATSRLLLAVKQRKFDVKSMLNCGMISTADHFLMVFEQAAGGRSQISQFAKAHKMPDWNYLVKKASQKLVFPNPHGGILGGLKLKDASLGDFGEPAVARNKLTEGSILDFDFILTTSDQDRDKDIINPMGVTVDPKMPILFSHIPTDIVGKYTGTIEQNEKHYAGSGALAGTQLGSECALLVELGALRISHGFNPTEYEPIDGEMKYFKSVKSPVQPEEEQSSGFYVSACDVFEASLVSIPANAGAEVIQCYSRGKFHHPITKLWGEYLFKSRPAQETSGYTKDEDMAATAAPTPNVNVVVNIDAESLTKKSKKAKKDGGVFQDEDGKWYVTVEVNGNAVNQGPFNSQEEAVAWDNGKSKAKKDDSLPSDTEEKPKVEKDEPSLQLGGIGDALKSLRKMKGMPTEAKDRVNMISNMAQDMQAKIDDHAGSMGEKLSSYDLAGAKDAHDSHIGEVCKGLDKLCKELEMLKDVEGLEEEHKAAVDELHEGMKAMSELYASIGQPLLNKEDGIDETSGPQTQKDSGLSVVDEDGAFYVVDASNNTVSGPFTTEQNAQDDLNRLESDFMGKSFKAKKDGGVFQDDDGKWYVTVEVNGNAVNQGPFNSQAEAVAWDNGKSVKASGLSVTEESGSFYVVDESGNTVSGPFTSQQNAQDDLNRLEADFTGKSFSFKEVKVEQSDPNQGGDGKWYVYDTDGSGGDMMPISGPWDSEGQAKRSAAAATHRLGKSSSVIKTGYDVRENNGQFFIVTTSGDQIAGPFASYDEAFDAMMSRSDVMSEMFNDDVPDHYRSMGSKELQVMADSHEGTSVWWVIDTERSNLEVAGPFTTEDEAKRVLASMASNYGKDDSDLVETDKGTKSQEYTECGESQGKVILYGHDDGKYYVNAQFEMNQDYHLAGPFNTEEGAFGWTIDNRSQKDEGTPLTGDNVPEDLTNGTPGGIHSAAPGTDGKFYVWEDGNESPVAGPFDSLEEAQGKADTLNGSGDVPADAGVGPEIKGGRKDGELPAQEPVDLSYRIVSDPVSGQFYIDDMDGNHISEAFPTAEAAQAAADAMIQKDVSDDAVESMSTDELQHKANQLALQLHDQMKQGNKVDPCVMKLLKEALSV